MGSNNDEAEQVSPLAQQALASWSVPPYFTAAVIAAGLLYGRGFRRLHRRMPRRFPLWRLAAYLGGLGMLLIAIASPLAAFDELLLQVHMTQHMLLMFAAPPLILLGAPQIPLLHGLPRSVARRVAGPLLKSRPAGQVADLLTHPAICWLALAGATWAWHAPGPYQLALRSEGWHEVEHGCFIAGAMLFWWPVVQPWPSQPRWPRWTTLPYLLLADVQNTALSAWLTFSDRVLYPCYETVPRLGGIKALDDQIAAGVIMWVPGSLFFLIPAAVIVLRLLSAPGAIDPSTLEKVGLANRAAGAARLGTDKGKGVRSTWR
jgi:cytochrome c oxidase assembly factor CtaG